MKKPKVRLDIFLIHEMGSFRSAVVIAKDIRQAIRLAKMKSDKSFYRYVGRAGCMQKKGVVLFCTDSSQSPFGREVKVDGAEKV